MTFLRKYSWAKAPLLLVCAALTLAAQEKRSPLPEKEKHPQALSATKVRRPNIVLMLTDNLGYGELGIYGGGILHGAPTPRIDKLASEGARLLNFNVEAQCTPSRSALMTGRFPIRSGTYQVPRGGVPEGLTTWEITLAQLLSAQGAVHCLIAYNKQGRKNRRFSSASRISKWHVRNLKTRNSF